MKSLWIFAAAGVLLCQPRTASIPSVYTCHDIGTEASASAPATALREMERAVQPVFDPNTRTVSSRFTPVSVRLPTGTRRLPRFEFARPRIDPISGEVLRDFAPRPLADIAGAFGNAALLVRTADGLGSQRAAAELAARRILQDADETRQEDPEFVSPELRRVLADWQRRVATADSILSDLIQAAPQAGWYRIEAADGAALFALVVPAIAERPARLVPRLAALLLTDARLRPQGFVTYTVEDDDAVTSYVAWQRPLPTEVYIRRDRVFQKQETTDILAACEPVERKR